MYKSPFAYERGGERGRASSRHQADAPRKGPRYDRER